MRLHTKILLSMALGAALGAIANAGGIEWLSRLLVALEPLGSVFINLISMTVIPLVASSVLLGITSLGDMSRLGRIGAKTLTFFLLTTLLASTIGFVLLEVANPAQHVDPIVSEQLATEFSSAVPRRDVADEPSSLIEVLVQIIPRNPFASAAQLDLLPFIIFVMIFSAALTYDEERRRGVVVKFFEGVNEACRRIIDWVMRLAPYAVFVLIAGTVARFGVELLGSLLFYSLLVAAGLAIQAFVVFGLILRAVGVKVTDFYRRIAEPLLLAFSSSSSNATLPVSLQTAQSRLGVSSHVAGFVIPLGAVMNMSGSALYKAATASFIAQVYGVDLGAGELITVVLTATFSAVVGVGVPGSSLATTLIVLNAVGLGVHASAGIALVLGVDRILDMLRTSVNVAGNLVAAVVIAHDEGETLFQDTSPRPDLRVEPTEGSTDAKTMG
jgi:DAACS family dicarboxylate/amino acid:cation (Na+ or H+) symporter